MGREVSGGWRAIEGSDPRKKNSTNRAGERERKREKEKENLILAPKIGCKEKQEFLTL